MVQTCIYHHCSCALEPELNSLVSGGGMQTSLGRNTSTFSQTLSGILRQTWVSTWSQCCFGTFSQCCFGTFSHFFLGYGMQDSFCLRPQSLTGLVLHFSSSTQVVSGSSLQMGSSTMLQDSLGTNSHFSSVTSLQTSLGTDSQRCSVTSLQTSLGMSTHVVTT